MKDRASRIQKWQQQIVTEEEYIELFATHRNDETFYGDWSEIWLESEEETSEALSLGEDSIEAE